MNLIPLFKHINKNYLSNVDFARKNKMKPSTVQTAINRDRHFINEDTGQIFILNERSVFPIKQKVEQWL